MSEEQQPIKVNSGYELAQAIGANPDESVLVAVFPETIEEMTTKEIPFLDNKGAHMHLLLVNCVGWGQRAIDVVSPNDQQVKWWRVKGMVADQKVDFIPIRWQGPIGEIPSDYFEKDYILGIRFYSEGPWFFPKEQPKLKTDTALMEAAGEQTNNTPDQG